MSHNTIKREDVAEAVSQITQGINAIVDAMDVSYTKNREAWMKKIIPFIMNVNPG